MNRNQYPCVEFDLDKLAANLAALVERCHDSLIEVAGVVKAVSSLPEIVRVYEESGVKFIATSRISQMRAIREAGICKKPLMLIRIPMLSELPDVVELCDISLQSDIIVLRALNEEAKKQGKVHEVILMMDLGDLREGFWNEEDALDAALEIEHELKNLRLAGVGVNLSCYGSVLPTKRNMQGLVSLASDIEREIGRKLDYISGGASTSAYMAMNGTMPYRINLLRLGDIGLRGETDNFAPDFLETGVMTIKAEVIECRDKPSFPVGELGVNAFGEVGHYEDRGIRRRALVAMGRVDYGNCFDLIPRMEGIEVIGASSDHTILDVEAVKDKVHVGDVLEFGIKGYGPMAYLTSSDGVHMVFKGGKQNA
jgi:alanine racemase domain-containing protein